MAFDLFVLAVDLKGFLLQFFLAGKLGFGGFVVVERVDL
jgi:hypothetical protein